MNAQKKCPMQEWENCPHIMTLLPVLMLVVMLTSVFSAVWYACYAGGIVLPFYRRGNWLLTGLYALVLCLFFRLSGGFRVGDLRRTDVLYAQLLAVFGANGLIWVQVSLIARRMLSVLPFLCMTLVQLAALLCWTVLTEQVRSALCPPRRLMIVYGSRSAAALVIKMSQRAEQYMICGSVSTDEDEATILNSLLRYDGVILHGIAPELRSRLLRFCYAHRLRTYVVPDLTDIALRGAQDIRLFDTPLLLCRNFGLTPVQRAVKRSFDVLFSLVMLALLAPVMLVCAAAVKLCDGGAVLYRQERLTCGGRVFRCCKFRSMIPDAERHGAQLADAHDARITPVGRVLRRFRLDELPQLFNILKGDMSVVGPRPERPELAAQYEAQYPEFRFRLRVKAGLTGYAQVTGVYDTTPYDKLLMDLMYIEHCSLFRDLEIILLTAKAILIPSQKLNAELLGGASAEAPQKGEST